MKPVFPALLALAFSAGTALADSHYAQAFIDSFDTNGDKQITMAEAEDRRLRVFRILDRDRDNQLTRMELVRRIRLVEQVLGQRGIDRTASSESIDRLIANYDQDGNGMISKPEYTRPLPQWFNFKDLNKDGVISAADARRR